MAGPDGGATCPDTAGQGRADTVPSRTLPLPRVLTGRSIYTPGSCLLHSPGLVWGRI